MGSDIDRFCLPYGMGPKRLRLLLVGDVERYKTEFKAVAYNCSVYVRLVTSIKNKKMHTLETQKALVSLRTVRFPLSCIQFPYIFNDASCVGIVFVFKLPARQGTMEYFLYCNRLNAQQPGQTRTTVLRTNNYIMR